MKTIKLTKKITLSSATTNVKQKQMYDALLTEIKQQYNIGSAQGTNWLFLKEDGNEYCNKLNGIISHYANGLFDMSYAFNVEIIGRQDLKIKLNFFTLLIDKYDFTDAEIDLYFKSEDFELLEIFGQSILIKQNLPQSYPLMIDLNDNTISISDYKITE